MINLNNKKLIHTTAVISGVLPVSYLITNVDLKEKSEISNKLFTIRLLGYIFSITTYLTAIILIQGLVIESGFLNNRVQRYGLACLIFLVVQILMSAFFLLICNRFYMNAFSFSAHVSGRKVLLYYGLNVSLGIFMTIYLFVNGPFLFVFASIYLVPNIYLYSRFKKMFTSAKNMLIFSTIFFITAGMFVFSNPAFDNLNNTISKNIVYLGYYYAPWLLYTLLLYLIWDIYLFITAKTQFNKNEWAKSYKGRRRTFILIALAACIIELTGIYNFNHSKIHKYTIQTAKNQSDLSELNIAFAADCHFSEITNESFIRQFINKMNSIHPDIVFLAGDIFESGRINPKMNRIQKQLKQINSKYGIYAVEGNHDYYSDANISGSFSKSGIQLLRDTVITVNNSFQIVGRMDRHNRNRKSLDSLLKKVYKNIPAIVLDHQPTSLLTERNKVDLYLSGHTHNGQLFPFNLIVKLIYNLPWGYKNAGSTHYFVTCGAQGWGPQVKTASHSEIMEIQLIFK